jgi:DNA-binding transcriptional regulator YiaG
MTLFFSRFFGRSTSVSSGHAALPDPVPDPVGVAATDISLACARTLDVQTSTDVSRPRFIRSDIDRAALADLKALLDEEYRSVTALTLPETLFDQPTPASRLTSLRGLATRAATARQQLGLTPQAVARSAKVTKQFVLDLEQGKASLDMGKVMRVLAALGVKLALV